MMFEYLVWSMLKGGVCQFFQPLFDAASVPLQYFLFLQSLIFPALLTIVHVPPLESSEEKEENRAQLT